ncbi:unnamed protein product [Medioppia subpectinata]|uniref:Uncharacterized protein n=1 Tax=Medioppia subpectinata TaxID=1979941 RepID=A0A7R9Q3L1_9ACAR|nr:unnamed protein product [Medioppia subpectinata]CAG2110558.1 unnamed protein product [Medioppia subpectinata]
MNVCLIAITLSSYWSAIKPTESHVLLLIDKLSPNSTTNANEEASLHFHRLANTHHLHNPCSPGRHSSAHPRRANPTTGSDHDISYSELTGMTALTALTGTPGNKPGLALLRELITKSTFLQGLVTNVIRMNLVEECTELRLPVVADVPNLDELKWRLITRPSPLNGAPDQYR